MIFHGSSLWVHCRVSRPRASQLGFNNAMATFGNFYLRESKKGFWKESYHFVTDDTQLEDIKWVAKKMRPFGGYAHFYHVDGPDDLEYYYAHEK